MGQAPQQEQVRQAVANGAVGQAKPAAQQSFIDKLLTIMVQKDAADLFITAGAAPSFKHLGRMVPAIDNYPPLTPEQSAQVVYSAMSEKQRREFDETKECNFSIARPALKARFRVSALVQRGQIGMVCRRIVGDIPTLESRNLPMILGEIIMQKMGLILVTGATGSGKSSTLAGMINHRNIHGSGHILTIEDPVEFTHEHKGCIVTQREVPTDTDSFENALKSALRQAPDVILVGEIRDLDTMQFALEFSGTGHLALATLHANTASQTLSRIINLFPPERHEKVWDDIAINLRAIVSQKLIVTPDGKGRVAAIEILINTPRIADLIRKGNIDGVMEMMNQSKGQDGMMTFDYHLFQLFKEKRVTFDAAVAAANSPNNLRLMIQLDGDNNLKEELENKISGLSLKSADNIE